MKETVTDYSTNDGTIVPVSSYFFERIEEGTVSLERAVVKVAFDAIRSGTDVIIVPAHHTKALAEHWSVVSICCKDVWYMSVLCAVITPEHIYSEYFCLSLKSFIIETGS